MFFGHHIARICDRFVLPTPLRRTTWTSGQPFLSSLTVMALERIDKTSNLVSDDPDVDNIVAALKRSDRVRQIMIACTSSRMEKVWTAMREPFTELTDLAQAWNEMVPVFPDSFLGRLPLDIPHSGYGHRPLRLTNLRTLCFRLESLQSFPAQESRPPPPPTRFLLPSDFYFRGVSEYLENFVLASMLLNLTTWKYPSSIKSISTPHNSFVSSTTHRR